MASPMYEEYPYPSPSEGYIDPRQTSAKRQAGWSPPVYPASAPSTPGGYSRIGVGFWKATKQRAVAAGAYNRSVHYGKRPSTGPKQPRGAGLERWRAANPGGARVALARWHSAPIVGYVITRPKSRILPIKEGFTPKRAGIQITKDAVNLKYNRRTGKYGRPTLKKGAL